MPIEITRLDTSSQDKVKVKVSNFKVEDVTGHKDKVGVSKVKVKNDIVKVKDKDNQQDQGQEIMKSAPHTGSSRPS